VRAILAASILALVLAGCDLDEPTLGGTVVSVMEAYPAEEREESPRYYEPPLVPEVAWKVEVQLDDGSEVTVTTHGPRRYEPGERVRLLVDDRGELLL
jgi:outer membrane lipoprotein SlyB